MCQHKYPCPHFLTILQMDPESCEPHALDQHLVNIKDYSQHQDSAEQEEEDSPFDELENILGNDEPRGTRQEHLLAERVRDLQRECNALREKCLRSGQQVNDLGRDLAGWEELAREEVTEGVIQSIEQQLGEFKAAMEEYRQRQGRVLVEKEGEVQRLRQEVDRLQAQKGSLEDQRNSLAEANQELLRSNESLLLQVQKLQSDLAQSRSQMHSSRSHRFAPSRRDHGFQSEVQAQLQILIEKLMAQLELERGQKKRLNEEIRRMQREAIALEKEVAAKNNKIYELEMNYLKGSRGTTGQAQRMGGGTNVGSSAYGRSQDDRERPSRYNPINTSNKPQTRAEPSSKSDRNQQQQPSPRNTTLADLLNCDQLSDQDRLLLSSKLIDFFSRRITAKDFCCYQLESLLVSNYSKSNPALMAIRKNTASPPTAAPSQEKMVCNLGEILDFILGEYLSSIKEEDSGQEYLLNLIGQIVGEKSGSLNDVYVIKQLIDDCVRSRKVA